MANKPMTKNEIVKALAEKTNLSSKDVKAVLEAFNELALNEIKTAGQFKVCDLGKLKLKSREARMMRNPQTGKQMKVPAKKVVKFTVAKVVKDKFAK
ncbi:MAG: HU family DNA-binding protein [Mycoplasmoidaceae bacterium]|nr:HU family DNA-binding protein [Mycoplasmoidaceae bacterium]